MQQTIKLTHEGAEYEVDLSSMRKVGVPFKRSMQNTELEELDDCLYIWPTAAFISLHQGTKANLFLQQDQVRVLRDHLTDYLEAK